MIDYLRSLFGLSKASGNRKVVGGPVHAAVKDLPYIEKSTERLRSLHTLCERYSRTPHERLFRAAYEKTKRIHTYLVSRGRGHELELFHLQHTDHFLNTFTVILDTHQLQHETSHLHGPAPSRRTAARPIRRERKKANAMRMLNQETSRQVLSGIMETNAAVPRLAIPEVSIDTFSMFKYLQAESPDVQTTHEIGYSSSQEEKDAFVTHVKEQFGIEEVAYVGNAMVHILDHRNPQPAEIIPIIHWSGCPYAISLDDERLYPVRLYRQG